MGGKETISFEATIADRTKTAITIITTTIMENETWEKTLWVSLIFSFVNIDVLEWSEVVVEWIGFYGYLGGRYD